MEEAPPLECVDGVCLAPTAGKAAGESDPLERKHGSKKEDEPSETEPNSQKKHFSKKTGSANPNIQKIHSQHDMDSLLTSNSAVIVEFMTTWCGACKGIAPLLEELATENVESVAVAQIVCDKNKETKKLAAAHGVKSYPVFVVFENGNAAQKWNGADQGKLEKAFEKLAGGGGKKGGKRGKKKGRW